MMMVYEANYKRLMQLVPDLRSVTGVMISRGDNISGISLHILEHCKYTTSLSLKHFLRTNGKLVPDLEMKIRAYHDAQVAEVVAYQRESRFASYYPYPNPKMRHHFEKRQINLFFSEWLKYCGLCGIRLTRDLNETCL